MASNTAPVNVNLASIIGPAFYSVHHDIKYALHRSYWLSGGRGSLKSSFAGVEIVTGIVKDPEAWGVGMRKVGVTLRDSILSTLEWAIGKLQMALFWRVTTSPAEAVYIPTGQKFICRGLDEPLKLKSIRPKRGYFKFLWWEEGQEYSGPEEMRSVRQSVLRGGRKTVEIVTFNPPPDPSHWINKEAKKLSDDTLLHTSNYKQVNPEWLGETFLAIAARLEQDDPVKYANEYMGQAVGNTKDVIFGSKCRVVAFEPVAGWDGPYFGCDWGFSQDPLVVLKMWIETIPNAPDAPKGLPPRMRLWVEHEVSKIGVEPDDMPAFFDQIPGIKRGKIRCDNARPELIAFMCRRSYDCVAVEKGPDSIEAGVTFLLNFVEIVVHPRCEEMVREIPLYKYKVDKHTKDVLKDIVDKDNHSFDAARYAIEPLIKKRNAWFG